MGISLDKLTIKGFKSIRELNDIGEHIRQRRDTWITLLVDYYGIKSNSVRHTYCVDKMISRCSSVIG